MIDANVLERLVSKIQFGDGCWLWQGAMSGSGYGAFHWGRTMPAHRAAYSLLVCLVPDHLHVDHLCFTPQCVNPDHLEPVTSSINARRAVAHNGLPDYCKRGHLYSSSNTLLLSRRGGERRCRTCHRDRERIRNARNR